tara:strand:- start:383 stop:625 length:243 start_codon:yes stop_codon:yes gene_type:complete
MQGGYPKLTLNMYSVAQKTVDGAVNFYLSTLPELLVWSKYATEIALSPDGRHIAFIEFGWVYLARAPHTFPAEGLEVSSR